MLREITPVLRTEKIEAEINRIEVMGVEKEKEVEVKIHKSNE